MGPDAAASSAATTLASGVRDADTKSVTVRLAGELDLEALPYLQARLHEAVGAGPGTEVVVDLSDVTFMDCSALGPLLVARGGLGGHMRLQGATRQVTRLFTVAGLSDLLSEEAPATPRHATPYTTGADVDQDSPTAEMLSGFVRMAGFVLSGETVDSALRLVTALAAETIPGTAGAGVTLPREGAPSTAAASDAVVEKADALQYELDEGPCLSSWRLKVPFRIDDTATEQRWPRWTESVRPLGLRSAMSTPMLVSGEAIGAIKVYSRQPGAFDEHDAQVLALFAAQAAILLANMRSHENATRLTEQLKFAIRSRDVIGMAKGILMVTRGIDETAAFAILAQTSQHSNIKLRDAAQGVIDHGRTDEE